MAHNLYLSFQLVTHYDDCDDYIIQGHVLREFSPEEVTSNIYTMVGVLLHNIQVELQHGLPIQVLIFLLEHNYLSLLIEDSKKRLICFLLQDLLSKASANIAFLIWTHELLPLDILLLALIDRDDDSSALRIVVIIRFVSFCRLV